MSNTSYRGSGQLLASGRPDLVDEVEIAVRLGASRGGMARMRRRGVLPRPTLLFEGHGIWLWETIAAWVGRPGRGLFEPDADPPSIDLVAIGQIASRLNVKPRIVSSWYASRKLPDPDYRWEFGDAWLWDTIERWKRGQGRATTAILRRQGESVRVKTKVQRPLVSAPIGVTAQQDKDMQRMIHTMAEFDRLKKLFLQKSDQAGKILRPFSA